MDYKEEILEAVSVIAKAEIEKVGFDTTIVCDIKDDSNASVGEYYVTDGSSSFYAYTENTSYLNGDSVYVTIPKGDFNNQKLIIGRHMRGDDDSTYISPLFKFVEKTKNLYQRDYDSRDSLIANFDTETLSYDTKGKSSIVIGHATPIVGFDYDTVYLKADFKSLLGVKDDDNRRLKSGDYGIIAYITLKDNNGNQDILPLQLNTSDMNGNVYDFETYYSQEKVFKLDKKYYTNGLNISDITFTFYQNGDFVKLGGQDLPWTVTIDDTKRLIDPNLFVDANGIEFKMGYEQEKTLTDQIVIRPKITNGGYGSEGQNPEAYKYYSYITDGERRRLENSGWSEQAIEDQYDQILADFNQKTIQIDYELTSIDLVNRGIVNAADVEYKLYMFYPPENGFGVSDPDAGENWQQVSMSEDREYFFVPNIMQEETKFKMIAFYNNPLGVEPTYDENGNETSPGTIKVKLQSEELVFSLIGEVKKDTTQKISIKCDNNGIFKIYNLKGKLINSFDKDIKRYLYAEKTNSEATIRSITWTIPYVNTMIEPMSYEEFTKDKNEKYRSFTRDAKKGVIIYTIQNPKSTDFYFRIKEYITPEDVNNTITCTARFSTSSTPETEEMTLEFCTIQPFGTEYKIAASFYDGTAALPVGGEKRVKIRVLASDNTDITDQLIKLGYTFNLEWYSKPKKSVIDYLDENYKTFDFLLGNSEDVFGARITEITEDYILSEDEIIRIVEDADRGLVERDVQNKARALMDNDKSMSSYEYAELRITDDSSTRYTHEDYPRGTDTIIDYVPDFEEYFSSHIIKITIFDYEGQDIVGYFSVPIAMSKTYTHFIGPTEIWYDSSGANPAYYKNFPKLMYHDSILDTDVENEAVRWRLYFDDPLSSTFPEYGLTPHNILRVPPLYVSGRKCINMIATADDGTQLWIQPIPIFRDTWDTPILNTWHNWSIHSVAAGAAKRLKNGNVSGVFLGEMPDALNYEYLSEKKDKIEEQLTQYREALIIAEKELRSMEEAGRPIAEITAQRERVAYLNAALESTTEELSYINDLILNIQSTIGLYGMYNGETFFSLTEDGQLKAGSYDELVISGASAVIQSRDQNSIVLNLRQNTFKFDTNNFLLDPFSNQNCVLKIKGFEVNRVGKVEAYGFNCGSAIIDTSGNIRTPSLIINDSSNGKIETPFLKTNTLESLIDITTPLLKTDKIEVSLGGLIRTSTLQASLIEMDQDGVIKTNSLIVNNSYGITEDGIVNCDGVYTQETLLEKIDVDIPDVSNQKFLTQVEDEEVQIIQGETEDMNLETTEIELTDIPIMVQMGEEFVEAIIPSLTIPALKIRDLILNGVEAKEITEKKQYSLLGKLNEEGDNGDESTENDEQP